MRGGFLLCSGGEALTGPGFRVHLATLVHAWCVPVIPERVLGFAVLAAFVDPRLHAVESVPESVEPAHHSPTSFAYLRCAFCFEVCSISPIIVQESPA